MQKMKESIIGIFLDLFNLNSSKSGLSSLSLENVEALATETEKHEIPLYHSASFDVAPFMFFP
jgi:hypothetical protein